MFHEYILLFSRPKEFVSTWVCVLFIAVFEFLELLMLIIHDALGLILSVYEKFNTGILVLNQ